MTYLRVRSRARLAGKHKLGLLLLIVPGLALLPAGCSRTDAGAPQASAAMPVKVQTVQDRPIGDASEYVATIKSRHSATIMSDVEGWIFDIRVHSGQLVKKGETLMEIDPRRQVAAVSNYDSQRKSKEAALQWAKAQLDRTRALAAGGVMSKQDLEQAQSNYDAALADVKALDAQIAQQQVQLRYYSVFAPTDGIVGDVPVHVGDRVTNTTPLTTIDERSGLEVYIPVPSEHAGDIRMGAPVEVVDQTGKVLLRTNVYFISPQVDTGTQSILVKAPADKAADLLRSMQLVRARIVWSTHSGITVPVIAVTRVSGQFFAFVAAQDNGRLVARQRPLQLGEIVGNDYTVLSGLKPGDRVIVAGGQNLAEGTPIRIEQ
ncbi:MAG TPA: efflux RND transporter periplasmic adaptor subunit [Candidatus Binatia bacterium]|nr:efflux RND transporter periplasmic adaptor subunit [Candidatus Binatia bacterium]